VLGANSHDEVALAGELKHDEGTVATFRNHKSSVKRSKTRAVAMLLETRGAEESQSETTEKKGERGDRCHNKAVGENPLQGDSLLLSGEGKVFRRVGSVAGKTLSGHWAKRPAQVRDKRGSTTATSGGGNGWKDTGGRKVLPILEPRATITGKIT